MNDGLDCCCLQTPPGDPGSWLLRMDPVVSAAGSLPLCESVQSVGPWSPTSHFLLLRTHVRYGVIDNRSCLDIGDVRALYLLLNLLEMSPASPVRALLDVRQLGIVVPRQLFQRAHSDSRQVSRNSIGSHNSIGLTLGVLVFLKEMKSEFGVLRIPRCHHVEASQRSDNDACGFTGRIGGCAVQKEEGIHLVEDCPPYLVENVLAHVADFDCEHHEFGRLHGILQWSPPRRGAPAWIRPP